MGWLDKYEKAQNGKRLISLPTNNNPIIENNLKVAYAGAKGLDNVQLAGFEVQDESDALWRKNRDTYYGQFRQKWLSEDNNKKFSQSSPEYMAMISDMKKSWFQQNPRQINEIVTDYRENGPKNPPSTTFESNVQFQKGGRIKDERYNAVRTRDNTAFDYKIENKMMTPAQVEAYKKEALKQRIGDIGPEKKQSGLNKIREVVLNPLTAFGYAARNQELPDNFSRGERNPFDYAVDVINPAQYAQDASNVVGGIATGDLGRVGTGAIGLLPLGLEARTISKTLRGAKPAINPIQNEIQNIKKVGATKVSDLDIQELYNPNRFDFSDLEQLKSKYKDEFVKNYGEIKDEKTLGLYAKLREANDTRLRNTHSLYKDKSDEFINKQGIAREYTPIEEILTDAYTRGYDGLMNKRFSKKYYEKDFYEKEVIPNFEELILKNKLKEPQKLYRGTEDYFVENAWRDGKRLEGIKFSQLQPGDEWTPKSFLSTSVDKDAAKSFGSILSEIDAPPKQSILFPNATGVRNFENELEAVLPSKLRYRVEELLGNQEKYNFKNIEDIPTGKYQHYLKYDGKLHYIDEGKVIAIDDSALEGVLNEINKMPIEIANQYKFRHSIVNPYVQTAGAVGLGTAAASQAIPNDNGYRKLKKGGIIEDDRGQWAHPGQITKINSNIITMRGVGYPVLGVSNTGDQKMMFPGNEYQFDGDNVTEFPIIRSKSKKSGGWLDNY